MKNINLHIKEGFPGGSAIKNQETQLPSLGLKDSLEDSMATHSSILAGKIPMDKGEWRATVHKVAKSQTRLKQQTSKKLNKLQVGYISRAPDLYMSI